MIHPAQYAASINQRLPPGHAIVWCPVLGLFDYRINAFKSVHPIGNYQQLERWINYHETHPKGLLYGTQRTAVHNQMDCQV